MAVLGLVFVGFRKVWHWCTQNVALFVELDAGYYCPLSQHSMRNMIAGLGKSAGLDRFDRPKTMEKKRAVEALEKMVAALILISGAAQKQSNLSDGAS